MASRRTPTLSDVEEGRSGFIPPINSNVVRIRRRVPRRDNVYIPINRHSIRNPPAQVFNPLFTEPGPDAATDKDFGHFVDTEKGGRRRTKRRGRGRRRKTMKRKQRKPRK